MSLPQFPSDHRFQFVEHATRLKDFFSHIEAGYHDGKPPHIVDPESSAFDIILYAEFRAMSTPEIQGRLRLKNIIVTGCPHSNMKFDEAGLQTLWPLDSPASIQGTT